MHVHRFLRTLLLLLLVEAVVEVAEEEDEVEAGELILNRNQPVASQISRHTVELYQNKSNVTKSKQIQSSLDSENFVPKY